MLKKVKPYISLLAAATMTFSSICNVNAEEVKQKNKAEKPTSNNVIIGDIVVPFTVANILNGMTYAISERGQDPNNLNVYFTRNQRGNVSYFDFRDDFSTKNPIDLNDGTKAWLDAKIEYNPSTKEVISFNTNVPTSSSTAIKPRSGYEGIITINGDQVTIPANTTPNILKGAIQSDDGIFGQTYELFKSEDDSKDDEKPELDKDAILVTGNVLKVISEDTEASAIYNLVVQSGGGGGQEDSADLEFKTNLDQGTLSYTADAADVDPLTVEVQGKDGATTGTISYQWYKQTVGTSPLRATAVPVGEAIDGETSASFTPPVNAVGTTLYYVIATNTEEGKKASSIASKMVTVVVSEGEIAEGDFTVSDYVYNMASDKVDTMGKLTGTAPSGAKITIEANFEEIATADTKEDGTWEATFPRQNAGTKLKVTLNANGKIATIVKEVKKADDKALDDFRKSIDLNKLIEVRDNLYLSKDKGATGIKAADLKDKAANDPDPVSLKDGDYYIEDDRNAVKAFKVYVDLIEAVLGYKYQISDVDLKYIQNIAIPTLETYKDEIQQVDGNKVTTYELTLSVGGNKQGTVTIKDKDAGAIVGDTSSVTNGVYTINNGKTVTITAIPNAQNTLAGWSIDKEFSKDNNTTREEKVTKGISVEAVFASPEEATKIDEVIKEIEEITANGTKPFEVSISETAPSEDKIKATVEAAIKEILPEGAEVKGVVLEEIPTRATTKKYKATVTFKVGNNVEFTITIEISVKVDSSINNVTASVSKAVYDKTNKGTKFDLNLNPYVEGITKTDITLTDGEGKEVDITSVTEVGTSGAKYYEVLAKLTKDIEYTIKVTKDGYNISTAKVTGLDEDSSTPTPVTASVTKAVYDKTNEGTKFDLNLTPYVEGITKTDITLTDGEGKEAEVASVTEAGTGETKYYEVLAKLTKDVEYTIKVTKDGYDIATTTVKGLDVDSPTPDEKGDFVQIKSFVIANDAEVNTSVEQIVYQKTVGESASQAVYKIYAKLSNPVANFSVGDTSVKFNLDLSATVTKNNVTTDYPDLLNGLRFNNVTRVLMKELSEDNSKLEITLDLDGVGESEDKATTHTINFKWVEPNKADVTGDPLKALKFKAYKFKK